MELDHFVPPRCPNRHCEQHWRPGLKFYRRVGTFQPRCRTKAIPRFECRSCGRGFSFQTFRLDYRDKRPDLNVPLFDRLTSGATLRHCARRFQVDCKTIQRKFRKIARHLRLLDRSLLHELPAGLVVCMDEQEDFEETRTKPVTIPIAVDRVSKLVLLTDVAPIRRAARAGSPARRQLARQESIEGRRIDHGRRCIRRFFGRLQRLLHGATAQLVTDAKPSYSSEHRRRLARTVVHMQVPACVGKDTSSPLFPIHLTQSMVRCSNARMRRRTWAKSKSHRMLRLHLAMYAVFRNWHRQRHNSDSHLLSPAAYLGLAPRRIEFDELLAWRQDWRRRSPHPLSVDGSMTIANWAA